MKGDNHLLAVTTTTDEITGETKPLFSFPIQVCKSTDDSEIRFDIAAPSGQKRVQAYLDPATDEIVTEDECKRGVIVGDEFHEIEADSIVAINAATKINTMVALGTMELADVPFDRQTASYYVQSPSKGGSPKSYRLVYEALAPLTSGKKTVRTAKALVTKRTARSRQKLCVIYADTAKHCLCMSELRFCAQLREPDEQILAPQLAQVEAKQIDIARQVIDGLGDGNLALESEVDEALALKQSLIEQALAGESLSVPAPMGTTSPSDDLTALLEASLAQV